MAVDLQLQIYLVAGILGGICTMLIFILAAVCGSISKLKRQHQELHHKYAEFVASNKSYDNYAYSCPTIQPDEELSRRGYSMYDPYSNNNDILLRVPRHNATASLHASVDSRNYRFIQQQPEVHPIKNGNANGSMNASTHGDSTRDATSDFLTVINGETVIMACGDDREMKIMQTGYSSEYHRVPPPPAVVNHFNQSTEAINAAVAASNNEKSVVESGWSSSSMAPTESEAPQK